MMSPQFVAKLDGLLNERQDMQRMIFCAHGYSRVNIYNQHCTVLEDKLEEVLSLFDDDEYKAVLAVPVEEWQFINEFKK